MNVENIKIPITQSIEIYTIFKSIDQKESKRSISPLKGKNGITRRDRRGSRT